MDQNARALASDVDPCCGSRLSTPLDSPTEDILHTRQSPTPLSDIGVGSDDAAVNAANAIKHVSERPLELGHCLQAKRSKSAIRDAANVKKQCRLQTADCGKVMEYRRVARPRKESVYSDLAPPSRSTKKQLTAADEQLLKRPPACNRGITGGTLQHYAPTGVSSAAASRSACSESSIYFSAYPEAHKQGCVKEPDTDLELTASFGATKNLCEPSAVLLQAVDTLQLFSPLAGSGLRNGDSDSSKNCSGGTDYPNVAAAPAAAARGPPSRQKSVSNCSSDRNSRHTRIGTARPSADGRSSSALGMRGVVSFRCTSDSRRIYPDKSGKSATRTNSAAGDEASHQPLRRLSSSTNLPVVWVLPPLHSQRQETAPTHALPKERSSLLHRLHSFRNPHSRKNGSATAQVAEGRHAGVAAGHHRGGGEWAAAPGHLPRLSELVGSSLDQHPYYVTENSRQSVPYLVIDAPSAYDNKGGEGFIPALRHAKSSCERQAGTLRRKQGAPVPPTGCRVFTELLDPLTAGGVSPPLPRQSQQSQQHLQRSPREPTAEYFRRTRRRRMKLAATADAFARADASTAQPKHPQVQLPQRAKAAITSSQYESTALSEVNEDQGSAAAFDYPAVAPSKMSPATGDDLHVGRDQRGKRRLPRRKSEQNIRLQRMFSLYMTGGQTAPGARRRAGAVQSKTKGRSEKRLSSGVERDHAKPIDYAALASERDPLDHLLGRHGFWGEAMKRCWADERNGEGLSV